MDDGKFELLYNIMLQAGGSNIKEMTYKSNKDSDQPGHPSRLIRVFAVLY